MQEEANIEQGEQPEIPKGFMTKEEWVAKGRDESDWRDPEEWKERGDTILPIVKKQRDELKNEIKQLKDDFKGDLDRIHAFNQKQEERVRNEERRRIEEKYELKRKEAFEDNDYDAIQKADADKAKELQTIEVPAQTTPRNTPDPAFIEFKERNPWYQTDEEMTKFADSKRGVGIFEAARDEGKTSAEAFAEVEEFIKLKFKDKFVNSRRGEAATVETDANVSGKTHDGKKIDSIKNDNDRKAAQAAFNRTKEQMKQKGVKYTQADFMASY